MVVCIKQGVLFNTLILSYLLTRRLLLRRMAFGCAEEFAAVLLLAVLGGAGW